MSDNLNSTNGLESFSSDPSDLGATRSAAGPRAAATPAPAPSDGQSAVEAVDRTLGRNVVLARLAAGLTQEQLAETAGLSRTTVAQIESGSSDPRISTVELLARALGVDPLILLVGRPALEALGDLVDHLPGTAVPVALSPREVEKMRQLAGSGFRNDRIKAAWIGVSAAREAGLGTAGEVGAGIGSALEPGRGTTLLAKFSRRLSNRPTVNPAVQPGPSATTKRPAAVAVPAAGWR